MHVQIVLFDGFDEIDVFGPFEPLALAGVTVDLTSLDHPGVVTSARGVRVHTTAPFLPAPENYADRVNGVIVPGGGWLNRAAEGSWAQVQRRVLPDRLVAAAAELDWIASVCAGGMVLAHAGLLRGRRATTNRSCFGEFAPLVGERVDERVVDDGDIITAGALTSGIDLGLHLVGRFLGADTAQRVARTLEYGTL